MQGRPPKTDKKQNKLLDSDVLFLSLVFFSFYVTRLEAFSLSGELSERKKERLVSPFILSSPLLELEEAAMSRSGRAADFG